MYLITLGLWFHLLSENSDKKLYHTMLENLTKYVSSLNIEEASTDVGTTCAFSANSFQVPQSPGQCYI